jgi:hypothetical protein
MSRVGVVVGLLAYVLVLAGCSDDVDPDEPSADEPIRTASSRTPDSAVPQVVQFRLVWAVQEAPGDRVPSEPGLTAPGTSEDDTAASSAPPPAEVDWSALSEEQSLEIANSVSTSGIGVPPEGYAAAFDQLTRRMNELDCGVGGGAVQVAGAAGTPMTACGEDGAKYVLSPAVIDGEEIEDASATVVQYGVDWVVHVQFDAAGTEALSRVSQAMTGQSSRFAVVANSVVLSAPVFEQPITDGVAQISGDLDENSAQALADALEGDGR